MSILSSCAYEKGKQVRVQRNNINKRETCVLNYLIFIDTLKPCKLRSCTFIFTI